MCGNSGTDWPETIGRGQTDNVEAQKILQVMILFFLVIQPVYLHHIFASQPSEIGIRQMGMEGILCPTCKAASVFGQIGAISHISEEDNHCPTSHLPERHRDKGGDEGHTCGYDVGLVVGIQREVRKEHWASRMSLSSRFFLQ